MTEKDHIKNLFQTKLSRFEANPPAYGWEKLEAALHSPKNKRVIPIYWYTAAAVAIILIVGGLFVFQPRENAQPNNISRGRTTKSPQVAKTLSRHSSTSAPTNKKLLSEHVEPTTTEKYARTHLDKSTHDKTPRAKNTLFTQHISMPSAQTNLKTIETRTLRVATKNTPQTRTREKNKVENTRSDIKTREELIELGQQSTWSKKENLLGKHADEDREISLAMNSNSSMMTYTQTGTQRISLRSSKAYEGASSLSSNSDHSRKLSKKNHEPGKAQLVHSQPISIGLTLSRKFSEKVSVEAGLMYTHLLSKSIKDARDSGARERQSIHYIGIPVNVNYKFATWKHTDLYLSLGGAAQKDVYGSYTYSEQVTNPENEGSSMEKISLKIKQKNPQFSVNGGLGIAYPIYNDLKLYGKFGAAYYFDAKNEYKTIYSDRKLVFDVNIGLKIDF